MYKDREGRVLDFLTQNQWDTLWCAVGPRKRYMETDSLLGKMGFMSFHGPYQNVCFLIKQDNGELFPATQKLLDDGTIEPYNPDWNDLVKDLDPARFDAVDGPSA